MGGFHRQYKFKTTLTLYSIIISTTFKYYAIFFICITLHSLFSPKSWYIYVLVGSDDTLYLLATCFYQAGYCKRAYSLLQSKGCPTPLCRFLFAKCCMDLDKYVCIHLFSHHFTPIYNVTSTEFAPSDPSMTKTRITARNSSLSKDHAVSFFFFTFC